MLCGLRGNFWRILSNPPFLLIKGERDSSELNLLFFPPLCLPSITAALYILSNTYFAPALSDGFESFRFEEVR